MDTEEQVKDELAERFRRSHSEENA